MTDEQIEQMREMIRGGKRLAWESSDRRMYPIVSIGMREDEVAANFPLGAYAALHNVEPEDILLISQPFVSDEDTEKQGG